MSTYPKTLTITDHQAVSMDQDALSRFRSVPVHNRNARMYYMDSEEEVRRMLKLIEDAKAAEREVARIFNVSGDVITNVPREGATTFVRLWGELHE